MSEEKIGYLVGQPELLGCIYCAGDTTLEYAKEKNDEDELMERAAVVCLRKYCGARGPWCVCADHAIDTHNRYYQRMVAAQIK